MSGSVSQAAPRSSSDLTGTIIDGRYQVRGLLGRGGMGAVYEAIQLQLDRRVAIKVLDPAFVHRDEYVARFMTEAKAASRIRHENVVQMLDFGELEDGTVYSVMEFLEGRDLAKLIRREGKLAWPRARGLLLQIIRGIKAVHAQGVIHRDIKPANLFLARDLEEDREVLKVLDFGVARVQTSGETGDFTNSAQLLGTPQYMAPELVRGTRAGPASEVYSIGVVAYQMLTGRLPFRGDSPFDALFRAATEPVPPLRSVDPSVPAAVEDVVLRMLAKDPARRYSDMTALYRAVAGLDEHGRPHGRPVVVTGPQPAVDDSTPVSVAYDSTEPQVMPAVDVVPPTFVERPPAIPRRRHAAVALLFATVIGVAGFAGSALVAATSSDTDAPLRAEPSAMMTLASAAVSSGKPASPVTVASKQDPVAAAPSPTVARTPAPAASPPTEQKGVAAVPTAPVGSAAAPSDPPQTDGDPGILVIAEDEPDVAEAPRARREVVPPRSASRPTVSSTREVEKPRTDAEVLRRIGRRAKARCGALLGGQPLNVTFAIGQGGEVLAPRGSRKGAAAECVIRILGEGRFARGKMRKEVLAL